MLTNTSATANTVNATYTNPQNNASLQTATDIVNQTPIIPQPPVFDITKLVRNQTQNPSGPFDQADSATSPVSVS